MHRNNDHNSPPSHETPWCATDKPVCDSTHLDAEISFDWGFDSPLLSDPSFPMDSFSAVWEGEIKVDKTDNYTFSFVFNGGVRLSIEGRVVIDARATESRVFHPIRSSTSTLQRKLESNFYGNRPPWQGRLYLPMCFITPATLGARSRVRFLFASLPGKLIPQAPRKRWSCILCCAGGMQFCNSNKGRQSK